ncbi:MAG: ANTAR domain-containing protein [Treponema sp.]|nr:ANTAR domain-containing protein [Treponema sp.]
MESVLIVSNTNTTMGIISAMLQSQPFDRIVTSQDSSEARRYLLDGDFDLVIIDTPLVNELGDDFSVHAAETTSSGIILVVEVEKLEDIALRVEDSGVFVLPKPLSPESFYQAVKLLIASRNRLAKLEEENRRLQRKLEETRTVDRAKCVLIERLQMTEAQAHRHIEKIAMDSRQSRMEVAESILRRYSD